MEHFVMGTSLLNFTLTFYDVKNKPFLIGLFLYFIYPI